MFNNKQEVIEVNEYGLFAFCSKIQELIKQGYEIDLTSNVRAPMSYGTMFVAYMTRNTSVPTTDSERVDVPTPESEVLPTELVVEKPQSVPLTEEKAQNKPASEPKESKVKKKEGTPE
jgi:hypothetical protein